VPKHQLERASTYRPRNTMARLDLCLAFTVAGARSSMAGYFNGTKFPNSRILRRLRKGIRGGSLIRSTQGDNTLVRLACSKNRLAPVKRVMLPRLELLAALVRTRLLVYLCEATGYDITQAMLWTDSTVALSWIRSDPNSWKTFVCTRVTEIQSHNSPTQWRHCPGQKNPTEHFSRGLLAEQIQSLDIWWHGPWWLRKHEEYWPSGTFSTNKSPSDEKKRGPSHVLTALMSTSLVDASKFSSYWKLVRTTAWVFRFLENMQGREKSVGELTSTELAAAHMHWVRVLQRETFTSELEDQKNSPLPSNSKIAR
jgi:hypothetical protein